MGLTASWKQKLTKFIADGTNPLTGVTVLYLSLHTADPTSGNQSTSEATFTGYVRLSTNRNTTDWANFSTTGVMNAILKTFGTNTGSGQTITHFGLGTSVSGAGDLILVGTINSPTGKLIATGDAASFQINDLTITG
jgi:hypothetical protein